MREFSSNNEQKIRSDAKGIDQEADISEGAAGIDPEEGGTAADDADTPATKAMAKATSLKTLRLKQQKRSPWRHHQSLAFVKRGKCVFKNSPRRIAGKSHGYDTFMRCEECSALEGRDVYLCNGTKGKKKGSTTRWEVCLCHVGYNNEKFGK